MDYTKLAQKLKKAGFGNFTPNVEDCQTGKKFTDVYMPSLEKLIEACGDKFDNLKYYHQIKWIDEKRCKYEIVNFWVCNFNGNNVNSCEDEWESEGETKKEAVANLYLELKKHKII